MFVCFIFPLLYLLETPTLAVRERFIYSVWKKVKQLTDFPLNSISFVSNVYQAFLLQTQVSRGWFVHDVLLLSFLCLHKCSSDCQWAARGLREGKMRAEGHYCAMSNKLTTILRFKVKRRNIFTFSNTIY